MGVYAKASLFRGRFFEISTSKSDANAMTRALTGFYINSEFYDRTSFLLLRESKPNTLTGGMCILLKMAHQRIGSTRITSFEHILYTSCAKIGLHTRLISIR
jgi:hypothetical protein